MPTVNEEILLLLISAHVANYVRSIQGRGYCDRDYIQTSIVIMGLTGLGYNTDYLLTTYSSQTQLTPMLIIALVIIRWLGVQVQIHPLVRKLTSKVTQV